MKEAYARPPVAKNQDLTLRIDALTGEGQGVAHVEGYAVFVPGTLEGETVSAHIIKVTSSYAVAKVLEILEPSKHRVEPRCPIFGRCGGCALQHLDYPAQLAVKQKQVLDALERLGGQTDVPMRPILGMEEPWRYRNKGSFPFGLAAGAAVFGFFAERSHRLIPLFDCPIQDAAIIDIARRVANWANESEVSVYHEETKHGILRHVMARALSTGETMAVIVTAIPLNRALAQSLVAALENVDSVWLNCNPRATNVILGDRFTLLAGKPALTEVIGGYRFRVSPQSFLQINAAQTAVLYEQAVTLLAPQSGETIIDAYCGIGTLTLMLSRHASRVIGVEQVPEAIEDAKRNAADNGVTNVEFLCDDVSDALPKLFSQGTPIGGILLDPPRKGCDAAVLDAILAAAPSRVMYVSCNPATLARDVKRLCANGYALAAVQPVDMFPQTGHVETCALLCKAAQ